MSKYTKGPWEIIAGNHSHIIYSHNNGYYICQLGHWNGTGPLEPDRHNARLIKAAPDLLEACKRLLRNYPENDCHRLNAEMAITKAEGKEG